MMGISAYAGEYDRYGYMPGDMGRGEHDKYGYVPGSLGKGEHDRYGYTPGELGKIEDAQAADNQDSKVKRVEECQTCKNRKYVDGSNETDVSFKAPTHISPRNSAAMVMSHEQMHVANARQEGSKENAELVSATVRLKTAVCPECGTTYVAGGVTNTTIKYTESNPYEKNRKLLEGSFLKGQYIDAYAG